MSFLLLLFACGSEPTPMEVAPDAAVREDPHAGVDWADATTCESCHGEQVGQWRESMHARAHHDEDPIYGAMRTLRMEKQGAGLAAKCARCHNPLDPEHPDSAAGKAGVACGTCHGPDAVVDDLGDGRTVCMHCHEATKNPAGVAACTTGPENTELGGASCTSCHMRTQQGQLTHQFLGPHRAWYQDDPSQLARALNVSISRDGGQAEISVTNLAGHSFPTGFPGRVAAIRLVGSDDAPGEPFAASPDELRFFKRYVDAEGKPVMPPFSVKLDADTRLGPGETRTVRVDVPEGFEVRAELVYRLLPPPAAKVLGLEDAPEAEPVVVPLGS